MINDNELLSPLCSSGLKDIHSLPFKPSGTPFFIHSLSTDQVPTVQFSFLEGQGVGKGNGQDSSKGEAEGGDSIIGSAKQMPSQPTPRVQVGAEEAGS